MLNSEIKIPGYNVIRSDTPNFDNQEVYILGDFNVNLKYAGRRIPNGVKKI